MRRSQHRDPTSPVWTTVQIRQIFRWIAGIILVLAYAGIAPGAPLPVLTQTGQLHRLTPDQAKLGYPVRLRGIVTYYRSSSLDLFIEDATGAIYVIPPKDVRLHPGQYVEVEGKSQPGDFASDVANARIRILGEAALPRARPVSGAELVLGRWDTRRIEVEAVVRSAAAHDGGLMLGVTAGEIQFKAFVPDVQLIPADLIGARIRIRGVSGGFYNRKDQFIALQVLVPSLADILVLEPAPKDQFTLPARTIHTIFGSPGGAFRHQVRIQGVVLLERPGRSLYIRDESVGLLVKTSQMTALEVGDRIDVVGFPGLGEYAPVLEEAIFRRTGHGAPPSPATVTAEQALAGSFDAELVRISGLLVESSRYAGQQSLLLRAGKITFRAEIENASSQSRLADLGNGSLLQLTGICSVQVDENREPNAFQILLRSEDDIVVLARPSWWTVKHAVGVLATAGVVILAVLGWVGALHRRVRRQTDTIRRRLEKEAALEQRFQYVARATNDAIWDWDLATNQGWWGESFYAAFGYKPEQVEPDFAWWAAHIHPDDRQEVTSAVLAGIGQGADHWSGEYRFRRGDGSYAYVYDRGYVLRDESGKPLRMIGAMMDMTLLRESQQRFTEFMDNSPAMAFLKDAEGRYIYRNKPLLDFLRRDDQLPDRSKWISAEIAKERREQDLLVLATGKAAEFTESITTAAGDHRDLLVFKFPVEASGQRFVGGFAIDITERKRVEAELQKAKEAAEAANRAKSEFLANMSHEIRTPMNGILGMMELALESDLGRQQREYLEIAQSSAGALLTIINDILDFSKIEAGKLALESVPFDLRDSLEPTLKALAIRANEKGLALNCEIRHEVPQTLVGDPGRLRQIVINLVGNAIKFTEQGQVTLRVERQAEAEGCAWLHMRVSDTGIGIPSEKHAAIFGAFTQADGSTARRFGGTGLGLTISRRLVEMMGGRIWLDSAVGAGTTFHFTARFGLGSPLASPAGSAISAAVRARQKSLRILLAEDNAVNKKLAVHLLEREGHQVVVTENGLDALAESGRQPFDLILMDIQMPEMDGLEATRAIRKRERNSSRHVPIIAMTAHAMKGDRELCLQAGMDSYVSKPITPPELFAAIEQVMGSCAITS